MNFSGNDLENLSKILAPEQDSTGSNGIYKQQSYMNPGSLGNPSENKPMAKPNHKVKTTNNRNLTQENQSTFKSNGRTEPKHEVHNLLYL